MRVLKPILATAWFVFMSLATPIFYRWYKTYFELGDGDLIGIFMTSVILYIGSIALIIYAWGKYFNIEGIEI